MSLELDRVAIDVRRVEAQLVHVIGGKEPGDDGRGARAEAARNRDLAADLKPQAVGWMQALERANAEVLAVAREATVTGVHLELTGLGDLELQMDVQRRGEDVESGAEVRRGCRHLDQAPAAGHRGCLTST